MQCPNCGKEMIYEKKEEFIKFYHSVDDEYYYRKELADVHSCSCDIKNINGKWIVPDSYLPTEKQKNTILKINKILGLQLEAVTKKQCWNDISKYLDKSKQIETTENYNLQHTILKEFDYIDDVFVDVF